ncbi:Polyketide synthase [Tolypocladium capitatum]|uniref:Polyketide synthase n=1 Tax=Tolypocladium capitatum TaxID=45235 RepID=A0A2K3QGI3_9HYPO|nr:Polyketide synthase [Tolypocladium capitatum]
MASLSQSPIAVIGVAYRAPGVGRKGLWDFLMEAKSAFSPIPKDRFEQEAYCYKDAEKAGIFAPKGAHFLPDNIYAFDAPFFNMNGEEVTSMDPQHRMMLECAVEAAENAGITQNELAGSDTGVFAAMERCEYGERLTDDLPTVTKYAAAGTSGCMLSNRLSYFFDLKGPSVSLDSACSSSAYAVHLACQSLRMIECSTAIVGASSLIVNANSLVLLDTMGALSPDGKCYSYDSRANGFGRGEGGACLILKRLDDAIAAGDSIHAVIQNTIGNHSGRTRGITMPSQPAQEDVLLRVHKEVGLEPSETTFVEGHGTGTQVGDPIDAGAVANVVAKDRANSVYIGSLKSNFGHLLSASGMLAIVKAIMMIRHATILPNAGFQEMNPKIEPSNLKVARTPVPWPSNAPKRVCVTNFGFGGSNAAVLLEEFQGDASRVRCLSNRNALSNGHVTLNGHGILNGHLTPNGSGNTNGHSPHHGSHTNGQSRRHDSPRLFAFSAKSEKSLSLYMSSFTSYVKNISSAATDTFMSDLSFTLGQRRTHFSHRLALAADCVEDLIQQLSSLSPSSISKAGVENEPLTAFIFTGQGAQHAKMAAELHQYEPFSAAFLDAEDCLQQFGATWSLTEELRKSEAEGSRVNDAEISQPACTAVQLGLVMLLRSWGITPTIVAGHSSGEIAAAYTAGLISFKTAMAIAFFRGRSTMELHQKSDSIRGGMIALGTDVNTAATLIAHTSGVGRAGIAAINSPNSVTVSGDMAAIDAIEQVANAHGLFNRKLKVGVAYHSHHMELVATSYLSAIEPYCDADRKSTKLAKIPGQAIFVSSVTGRREVADTLTNATYWVRNLVSPVRFSEAIVNMLSAPDSRTRIANVIVEVGPHAALKGPVNQTIQSIKECQATYLPALIRGIDATKTVLGLAQRMFTMGRALNFAAVNKTNITNACVLTDLPSYEWNKNASYLHKSRIAVQKMHPGHTYSPLLGWKMPSEGSEHTFRQVFTLDEMPWIRDHKVMGDVLFPFSGFMSLAVDAFRSVTGAGSILSSVLIRELHVKRGLRVIEEQRVDISTKLRPAETGTGEFSSTIWAFEVMTWAESTGWTTHVYGRIEAGTTDMTKVDNPRRTTAKKLLSMAKPTAENAEEEYKVFQKSGVSFGPTFKNMVALWTTPSTAVHETMLRQIDEPLSALSRGSHVTVDPPTLDTLFHSAIVVAGKNHQDPRPAFVPVYLSRVQISNMIPATAGQKFTTVTRRRGLDEMSGRLELEFVIFANAPSGPVPCLEVDMTMQRITQPDKDTMKSMKGLPEGYYESLVPHVNLVDGNTLAKALADYDLDHKQLDTRRKLAAVGRHFLAHALNVTVNDDLSNMPPYLNKFLGWAKKQVTKVDHVHVSPRLIDEVSRGSATGELLCAVGQQIGPILRGQLEPLEIMMNDGLLTRHYEDDMATHRGNQALSKYVAGLGELNPNLRILEVGGGTGSATLPILEALSGRDDKNDTVSNFSHYAFTDISSGFFEDARKKLARWPQLTYKKLDISCDPAMQGIEIGTYDLVIATNVLHATRDIEETIRNVRALLKPGTGKLGILEIVNGIDPSALPFTLLPGWWLAADDFRRSEGGAEDGPLMSQGAWHRLLASNGFSGVDGEIEDWPGAAERSMSAIWSTRVDEEDDFGLDLSDTPEFVTICGPMVTAEDLKLAEAMSKAVEQSLSIPAPQIQPLAEFNGVKDRFCIFLDSGKTSFLTTIASEHDFDMLKSILLESNGLLWVTPKNDNPEYSRIKGLLRTIRLEDSTKKLLLLENIPHDPMQGSAIVARVAQSLLRDRAPTALRDQEFVWQDGMIQVPRLRKLRGTQETFAIEAGVSICKEQDIWEGHGPDNALRMSIDTPGSIDSIFFERHCLTRTAPLGDDEIIVKIDAVGVNFRDLLLLLGTIPWSLPGVEGAGTVMQVGPNVSHVQTGDRVFYMVQEGGCSTYVRMSGLRACKLPDYISAADAASLPAAYSTALMCLVRVARLRRGESVLIHAASGAVGQACIRLAQNMGAVVFATAGSVEKKEFLHKTFAIPVDHIYSSRTPNFRQGIMSKTDGKGVDVVVNSLSGQLLQETWSLVAEFGRFIEIGKKDVLDNSHLGMRNFYRNVTFTCVDLDQYFVKRPEFLKDCLIEIVDMLERKVIGPIEPVTKLPVSEMASGFRKLQGGLNIGKIVVIMKPGEKVMAETSSPLRHEGKLLQTDATYLITGGTGGIGRSLVPWMLDNGAANVIILGRSGASNPEVAKVIQQYNQPPDGIHVRAIACDVASRADLGAALGSIKDLPPVRGVIHGSLYLHDSMFMNATFQDWHKINGPKIDAAWHLHELLPTLDFFIALASGTSVVGNIGQSIYGGTSAFLDAFAKYRTRQGLPTVSISLPIVDDVGYVIERAGMREQLESKIGISLSIAQVHAIIKGAIIGASSGLNHDSKTFAFVREDSLAFQGWEERSHYLSAIRQKKATETDGTGQHGGGGAPAGEEGVLEALSSKVSSITMIDRDDVTPTRRLLEYGLDSLVAVELRNWIKREYGVELALMHIVGAANLQTLADQIISRQK